MKNIYEIFDEFILSETNAERIRVLRSNAYPHFLQILKNTFDPNIKFYIKQFPKEYIEPDTFPGIRYAGIESEIRKTYLFQIGNPIADSLTESKRTQLLIELLESFEPKEAQIYVNMLKKDLKIPKLTCKLVKETFPDLL